MLRKEKDRLLLILVFSLAGGIFKIAGGIIYHSKSVLVDALTSMANLASLVLILAFMKKSSMPPDENHHFGHVRLKFGGSIFTLMAYSFVAGIALMEVLSSKAYTVSLGAPAMAALGLICYLMAISLSKESRGGPLGYYATFTVSEVIEGITVIASSLTGAIYSYIFDYLGSIALTFYVFYELLKSFKDLTLKVSDIAPPLRIVEGIKKSFESRGLSVEELKMRYIDEKTLEGHMIIIMDKNNMEEFEEALSEAKREAKEKYNAEIFVEFDRKKDNVK